MYILSAEQIRRWDEYTIQHEPILSVDLMERAANACLDWLESQKMLDRQFSILCGKGNNGGDGLALARLLTARLCPVVVYILEFGHKGTEDFQVNLARLHQTNAEIRFIQNLENIPESFGEDILIDALFGSGLNRPLEGVTAALIEKMNQSGNEIIAIDIPSGMYVEKSSSGNTIVKADHTLSFQCYKPAFLVAENQDFLGRLHILDIGLDSDFMRNVQSNSEWVDMDFARALYKPRRPFAHKGNFGHALLIAGGWGKMGAALLAARACLRTGPGLLTCHVPRSGNSIMQGSVPEAMLETDESEEFISSLNPDLDKYRSVGMGPGIGTHRQSAAVLFHLMEKYRQPVVLDADALNILAENKDWLKKIPPYSLLSPHPKEFERLFGPATDDFHRILMAREQSRSLQCIIILKGHHTFIAVPGGGGFFNSTGNPGMARGGSGDALTGILTGLLAQGYPPIESAILGVFIHGLAGDLAASIHSEQSMLPSDLIDCIGKAFLALEANG